MRTLYVSDLDGTLLRHDETLSAYTCETLNRLIGAGVIFSFATARSAVTARRVTSGLTAAFPIIVYNGAFLLDHRDGRVLWSSRFSAPERKEIFSLLGEYAIEPIVYATPRGRESFSYLPERLSAEARAFVATRRGDPRDRPLQDPAALPEGDPFYFTCIGDAGRLAAAYDQLKEKFYCTFQQDIYTGAHWLEIMPRNVSKANAVQRLKALLQCDRVVSFGDAVNDLPMFEVSDECYAVENAAPQLKEAATGIIPCNEADGVAGWLAEHAMAAVSL